MTAGLLLSDEQLPLASALRAVHVSNGKRYRDLFAHALVANGTPQGQIARETEREPSAITRMLSGEQGFASDVQVAILAHDALGIIVAGIAAMTGYEPPRRKVPDLAEENRRLRARIARLTAALEEP